VERSFLDAFLDLISKVITEAEGFNGKRPYGDSGWEYEFEEAMEYHGVAMDDVVKYIKQAIVEWEMDNYG